MGEIEWRKKVSENSRGMIFKCEWCNKEYNTTELLSLLKIIATEEEEKALVVKGIGCVPVCECGYRFYLDRTVLHDNVKVSTEQGDVNIMVSTVYLESFLFSFLRRKEFWWESMIFPDQKFFECNFQMRYKTKEEAIKGHNRIITLLKLGKYNSLDCREIIELLEYEGVNK